jgi:hypothetical protein
MARSTEDYHSFQKLREYCETLQLAANLVLTNSPHNVRVAFILLHNIAELLMYSIAEREFESDEMMSKVRPPQFSRTLKRRVRREFTEQVRFVMLQGVLSAQEGSTLQIAHDYRTPAFHRDDHNPKALQSLACLLYSPIATLFEKASAGQGSSSTQEERAWLESYGVKCDGVCMFDEVSVAIVAAIRGTIPVDFEGIRSILYADLTERITIAESKMSFDDELGGMVEDWNDALSEAMFKREFDEQAAGANYWGLLWKLGAGEHVVPGEFIKAEAEFNAEKMRQKATFAPPFEFRQLPDLKDRVEKLKGITDPSELAGEYHDVDMKLILLEDAIADIHVSMDAAIQHAIDLARGK